MKLYLTALFFATICFLPGQLKAAFPVAATPMPHHVGVKEQGVTWPILKAPKRPRLAATTPPAGRRSSGDGTMGVVSLALGIAGWMIVLLTEAPGIFGVLGIACAVGAVVTGCLGMRRGNKGMAIAGFLLGAMELLIVGAAVFTFANW